MPSLARPARSLRLVAALGVAGLVASACAADAPSSGSDATGATASQTTDEVAGQLPVPAGDKPACVLTTDLPGGDVPTADRNDDLFFPWELQESDVVSLEGFDPNEIVTGGVPPDGIRPIELDEVCFDEAAQATRYLAAQSPVMVVEVEGETRAYPLGIMTQHEIVNDIIAGVPVVVTYCPLCNSGLAFERTVDGEVLSFGTSGRLFQSNLVMYDRQNRNLWSQFNGTALVGTTDNDLVGTELERLPTSLLGFGEFLELAPDGLVLSPDISPSRDYGRNPYPGYDDTGIGFGLFSGPTDERLPPNTRVVGVGVDVDPVAVPLPRLQDERVVEVDVDGTPVSVWWAPGASSALDTRVIDNGQDVGQTLSVVALDPDGGALTFQVHPDDEALFVDDQTGTSWDLFGRGVEGELAGTQLEVLARDDTFWFVWFAFQPDTRVANATA